MHCSNTSVFDSYERFDIHMIQQHEPNITCIHCDRSISPVQYSNHYSACCKSTEENHVNARKQQITDLNDELSVDDSQTVDEEADKIDVNDIEGTLAGVSRHNDTDEMVHVHITIHYFVLNHYSSMMSAVQLLWMIINQLSLLNGLQNDVKKILINVI